jgi:phage shock protein PspC (stress-responsive transcriptional regulator)
MNKNISINISGIIFHIDENAYEELKSYLDSIHRYFASFEGSSEIIADIESRIAEIFLSNLTESKQVITLEDVESLKIKMGSVKDFEAAEEEIKGEEAAYNESGYSYEGSSISGGKRLYRDVNRKIISGVAAGIAYYFKINPLWIRLILILLAVGSYGIVIIIYIILWMVLPESNVLTDDQKIKKMYRNPQDKVLGGVSSGIAAYFGVDATFVRLLFIIFTFLGGSGLIAYIILWIILPEAKSITDRMQMEGDPITLSNIESNIRKSLNVKRDEEENLLLKIILFPFRLIAAIFNGLSRALGPLVAFLVELIRIVAGLSLIVTGFIIMLSLLIITGVIAGIWPVMNMEGIWLTGIPLDVITNSFPFLTAIAAFFLIAVPALFILLAGASIIAKRLVFNAAIGWTLFSVFFISLIIASFTIPMAIVNFQERGEHQVVHTYDFGDRTSIIKLKEVGWDKYDVTDLEIRGYEGPEYKLVQVFKARGRSRKEAAENAQLVKYAIEQQDSILIFDSNIQFEEGATFRVQQLEMTLYIPYGKEFIMDRSIRHILENTLYPNGYSIRDLENNRWMFTEENGLRCITCAEGEWIN